VSVEILSSPDVSSEGWYKLAIDCNQFSPKNKDAKCKAFGKIMVNAGNYAQSEQARDTSTASASAAARAGGRAAFSKPAAFSNLPLGAASVGEMGDVIYSNLNNMLDFFVKNFSGQDPETGQQINPIFAMQTFGIVILGLVEIIWLTMTASLIVMAILGFVGAPLGPFIQAGFTGILAVVLWVAAWLAPILMFLFMTGMLLAHYIPLIPFLYFTFGAIGWLMLVFEAMVAAPIVALGILHPEEHDIFGKASPALMLITNVFLTPSLLLFGLIGAMMISYIAVSIVNFGFYNVLTAFSSSGVSEETTTGQVIIAVTSVTVFVSMILIYTATIMWVVERCFSLIPELRTKVLTWIGGQGISDFGETRGIGETKAAHEKGGKAAGEAQAGGAKAGADKAGAARKGMAEKSKKPSGGEIGSS